MYFMYIKYRTEILYIRSYFLLNMSGDDYRIIMLASKKCSMCKKMEELIKRVGADVDIVVVDTEDGSKRLNELMDSGMEIIADETPQCFFDYGDGVYLPCDARRLYEDLKEKALS